jgi:hypothetical protein
MDDLQSKGSYLKNEAGKGDRPRNCFSDKFRDNYDLINWSKRSNSKSKDTHPQEDHKNV